MRTAFTLALLLTLAAHGAAAREGDRITVALGTNLLYDDNFLRLPDGVQPSVLGLGERSRGTFVTNPYAQIRADLPFARQRLTGSLTANYFAYSEYSQFNFSGWNADLRLNWVLGNRWTGNLAYVRDQALTSFADVRVPGGNIRSLQTFALLGEYWLHPRWRLSGGAGFSASRNSAEVLTTTDLDQTYFDLGFRYESQPDNYLRPAFRYTSGDWINRSTPSLFQDTGFTQYDIGVEGAWRVLPASVVSGRIGYTWRQLPNLTERDFAGITGRLSWDWTLSGKTGLFLLAARDVSALEVVTANYIVSDDVRVGGYWRATAKVRIESSYQRLRRTFAGNPLATSFAVPERVDDFNIVRANLSWAPYTPWLLTLGYVFSDRTSNFPGQQFTDNTVSGSVQYTW